MWCNYKFTPQYCGPQNCGPTRIDRFLVAFGRIFRSLFGYTGDSINQLIDKTFDSHQEYTIATSSLAPARGTKRAARPAALFVLFQKLSIEITFQHGHLPDSDIIKPAKSFRLSKPFIDKDSIQAFHIG